MKTVIVLSALTLSWMASAEVPHVGTDPSWIRIYEPGRKPVPSPSLFAEALTKLRVSQQFKKDPNNTYFSIPENSTVQQKLYSVARKFNFSFRGNKYSALELHNLLLRSNELKLTDSEWAELLGYVHLQEINDRLIDCR